jgi:hypothetical protein
MLPFAGLPPKGEPEGGNITLRFIPPGDCPLEPGPAMIPRGSRGRSLSRESETALIVDRISKDAQNPKGGSLPPRASLPNPGFETP